MGIESSRVPVLLFTDHLELRKFIKQGGLVSGLTHADSSQSLSPAQSSDLQAVFKQAFVWEGQPDTSAWPAAAAESVSIVQPVEGLQLLAGPGCVLIHNPSVDKAGLYGAGATTVWVPLPSS